jgi:hypothetical protein
MLWSRENVTIIIVTIDKDCYVLFSGHYLYIISTILSTIGTTITKIIIAIIINFTLKWA